MKKPTDCLSAASLALLLCVMSVPANAKSPTAGYDNTSFRFCGGTSHTLPCAPEGEEEEEEEEDWGGGGYRDCHPWPYCGT